MSKNGETEAWGHSVHLCPDSQERSALCRRGTSQGKVALRTKNFLPDSLGLDSTEDSGSHAVPPGGITLARTGQ